MVLASLDLTSGETLILDFPRAFQENYEGNEGRNYGRNGETPLEGRRERSYDRRGERHYDVNYERPFERRRDMNGERSIDRPVERPHYNAREMNEFREQPTPQNYNYQENPEPIIIQYAK